MTLDPALFSLAPALALALQPTQTLFSILILLREQSHCTECLRMAPRYNRNGPTREQIEANRRLVDAGRESAVAVLRVANRLDTETMNVVNAATALHRVAAAARWRGAPPLAQLWDDVQPLVRYVDACRWSMAAACGQQ